MRAYSYYFACLFALCSFTGPSGAQSIDDDTKCHVVNAIMAAPGADKENKSTEVISYIQRTMKALDHAHSLQGKSEIFPQMTANGQSAVALVAASRCRRHPDLTVADMSVETYEAVRAMQAKLGLKKSDSKLARSDAPHQPGLRLRGTIPPTANRATTRLFDDL